MNKKVNSVKITLTQEEYDLIKHLREKGSVPDKFLIENDRAYRSLNKKHKQLKQKYEHALHEINSLKARGEIFEFIQNQLQSETELVTIPLDKIRKSKSIAVAVASDWHVEERVTADTVNNLNEFNLSIAEERIKTFFKKIVTFTNIHRNGTSIDTLILALLGDFITGFIHDEYKESNHLTPLNALRFLQGIMTAGLDYLLKHGNFKKIIIPCSFGNHGRTTKEMRYETAADNSLEQYFYYLLAFMYRKEKRLKFIINSSYHTYINVFDKYLLRFHHGDSIRYNGGVGGITIPVNKAISAWDKTMRAYLDVFGHFHQFMDGGKFISNGSLIGYNAFALKIKASYERPAQTFFLIEKDYGKTVVQPIILG